MSDFVIYLTFGSAALLVLLLALGLGLEVIYWLNDRRTRSRRR